jgi:hypothetical protein
MTDVERGAHDDVEEILERRRQSARRSRRLVLGVWVAAVAGLSFILVPAMRGPVSAWQWQVEGIQGEASVNGTPGDTVPPATCSSDSDCWEFPVVVVDLTGGPAVTAAQRAMPLYQATRSGGPYLIGVVPHRVASANARTFPVWILADSASVTSEAPPSPVLLALTTWWWLLIAIVAVVFYPRLALLLARRRSNTN